MIIPKWQPGEFIDGFVGRMRRINGLAPSVPFYGLVARHFLLPTGSSRIEVLAASASMSTGDFLSQHTVLPVEKMTVRCLPEEHADADRSIGSTFTLPETLKKNKPARLCPHCVKHDLNTLGFSYWRTHHQLPAVDWCNLHSSILHETTEEHAFASLPHELLDSATAVTELELSGSSSLLRYVLTAIAVLDLKAPVLSYQIALALKRRAQERGLRVSNEGHRPILSDIVKDEMPDLWLQKYFPKIAHKQPLKIVTSFDRVTRPRQLAGARTAFLLALVALSDSAHDAMHLLASTRSMGTPLARASKKPVQLPRGYWTSDVVRNTYLECAGNHTEVARRLGTSTGHTVACLNAAGLPSLANPVRVSGAAAALDFINGTPFQVARSKHDVSEDDMEFWLRQDLRTIKPLLVQLA